MVVLGPRRRAVTCCGQDDEQSKSKMLVQIVHFVMRNGYASTHLRRAPVVVVETCGVLRSADGVCDNTVDAEVAIKTVAAARRYGNPSHVWREIRN